MHPNPVFRQQAADEALRIAAERGFGIVTAAGPEGPLASHLPFLLEPGAGPDGAIVRAECHLVRSTALARVLRAGPLDALLIASGPDGYVSPDWYGVRDKVPTWNYVAVHLRGRVRLAEDLPMRAHLDRLSARFEGRLPKVPWTADKMDPEALDRMMRTIVPVEFTVHAVESTMKLNQNREPAERAGAAAMLAAGDTPGMETPRLAALMRAVDSGA